jgi:ABC-type multidrug transport system fused ATPase/permease subunit
LFLLFISSFVCLLVGVVSQEPVSYDTSIRRNITYGDNTRQDIPLEHEINCGAKGTQLSQVDKNSIC